MPAQRNEWEFGVSSRQEKPRANVAWGSPITETKTEQLRVPLQAHLSPRSQNISLSARNRNELLKEFLTLPNSIQAKRLGSKSLML